ncbi:MAG: hypothetical protein ACI9ND_002863 [Yoonia sp.]|jgi:hypothetical protein
MSGNRDEVHNAPRIRANNPSLHPTCLNVSLMPLHQTRNGLPTSPTFGLLKVGFTSLWSLICSRAASLAGPLSADCVAITRRAVDEGCHDSTDGYGCPDDGDLAQGAGQRNCCITRPLGTLRCNHLPGSGLGLLRHQRTIPAVDGR